MRKQNKYLLLSLVTALSLFVLSGCVQTKNGVPTGDGWVYNLLVRPMGSVIQYLANNWHMGYGWAIILVTLLVRVVIILPLGLSQSWKSTYQAEKRNYLQPHLEPLNEKMRQAEAQEEKLAIQQQIMQIQRDNGVSLLGGIGCLPIIIQWPFFSALFYATRYTKGIAGYNFLGMNLGETSLVLVVLTGLLYLFQGWLSTLTVPEEQQKQMRQMMFLMPLMMVFFTWSAPAGGAIYWLVSGAMGIIQQVITMYWIRPIMKERIDKEFEENPPKIPDFSQNTRKDVTPQAKDQPKNIGTTAKAKNKANPGRNAGKQNHK